MNKDNFIYNWYKNQNLIIALLIFLYPLGWYGMLKGEHFSKKARYVISAILGVWTLILIMEDNGSSDYDGGSGCSAVIQQNGCTYYRDSNCNVIQRVCN